MRERSDGLCVKTPVATEPAETCACSGRTRGSSAWLPERLPHPWNRRCVRRAPRSGQQLAQCPVPASPQTWQSGQLTGSALTVGAWRDRLGFRCWTQTMTWPRAGLRNALLLPPTPTLSGIQVSTQSAMAPGAKGNRRPRPESLRPPAALLVWRWRSLCSSPRRRLGRRYHRNCCYIHCPPPRDERGGGVLMEKETRRVEFKSRQRKCMDGTP